MSRDVPDFMYVKESIALAVEDILTENSYNSYDKEDYTFSLRNDFVDRIEYIMLLQGKRNTIGGLLQIWSKYSEKEIESNAPIINRCWEAYNATRQFKYNYIVDVLKTKVDWLI